MTRHELVNYLVDKTTLVLIEQVCFAMGIKYDQIRGEKLNTTIIGLLNHCIDNNRLSQLEQELKEIQVDVSLGFLMDEGQNNTFRADENRLTWTCNMSALTEEMQRVARRKTGLVGCTISCSPETQYDGLDKVLENLCRKSRAILEWDNVCYIEGGSKLSPMLGVKNAMDSIKPQIKKMQQGKNVFFRLQLHEAIPTSDLLANFWMELQKAFEATLGKDLDKLQTVFIVVMGSCPKEAAFPGGADIHYLGEFKLTSGDLDDWMYRVVSNKSRKWMDPRWDKSIPTKWAEHIAAYSELQQRLIFGSINTYMQQSLELLDESIDGDCFLEKVTQTFS